MSASLSPPIRGIDPISLSAWEGRVATVIYLPGCTLDCPNCPVPYLKPRQTVGGTIPVDGVLDAIYMRRRWIEGVVVRGGEPLIHAALFDLLETLSEFGIPVKLCTNGTRPDALARLFDERLVDLVSLDLKGPLDDRYAGRVGGPVDLGAIYRSIERMLQPPIHSYAGGGARRKSGVRAEFRIEYDGRSVTEGDVLRVARTVSGARRLVLVDVDGPRPEIVRLARRAEDHVRRCVVEGPRAPATSAALSALRELNA